jgi:multidrug resistance efflux pump
MSDLHNRNAEAFKEALIQYREVAETLNNTVKAQQAAVSSLMARVAQLELDLAILRISKMGRGSTTE